MSCAHGGTTVSFRSFRNSAPHIRSFDVGSTHANEVSAPVAQPQVASCFQPGPFHHDRNRSSKRELALDYFTGYRIRGPRLQASRVRPGHTGQHAAPRRSGPGLINFNALRIGLSGGGALRRRRDNQQGTGDCASCHTWVPPPPGSAVPSPCVVCD